ncbi:MAG: tRNA threonylcarbamoyladenosine dehydratase [Clostridiales bacterium]|nr:tRNA threonylcarbamoyladenosine dehydratase [Clostridiales bacterium]
MDDIFSRTEMLIGSSGLERLQNSKVTVVGIGGVGSYTAEALARSGIGDITIIDSDKIDKTNINRQIHANVCTIGLAKVDVMSRRMLAINPDINIKTHYGEYNRNFPELISADCDYVIDAIDTISSKIDLVIQCKQMSIPIISSMGAGNKLDPTKFKVGDIFETHTDPIARIMRRRLKDLNIDRLKVVWSAEKPIVYKQDGTRVPSSIAFVPSVVGLIMAGEVIKDLIGWESSN